MCGASAELAKELRTANDLRMEDAERWYVGNGQAFCRRASRSSAAGSNTEGAPRSLLRRIAADDIDDI